MDTAQKIAHLCFMAFVLVLSGSADAAKVYSVNGATFASAAQACAAAVDRVARLSSWYINAPGDCNGYTGNGTVANQTASEFTCAVSGMRDGIDGGACQRLAFPFSGDLGGSITEDSTPPNPDEPPPLTPAECQSHINKPLSDFASEFTFPVSGPSLAHKRTCAQGCLAIGPGVASYGKKGGQWTAIITDTSQWRLNGSPCDPLQDANASVPPVRCPTGQCPGTVNGTSICVACDATATASEKTVTTPPTPPASAPTVSTDREVTVCENGKCTTTTRNSLDNPATGTGPVETEGPAKEQDQPSFCQENPQSPICKEAEKSQFGGACAAGFSCSGDAIQCAIARETFTRNCEFFGASDASALGAAAAAAGIRGADHPALTPSTVSLANGFNQDSMIGAGACPADISVSMGSLAPVVIAFGPLCTVSSWLGNLLVGLTALACLGIVFVRGR